MDLEFYPMSHGDPYNGDWVLLLDGFGRYNPCRWTKDAVCRFITRSGKAILDNEAVGWLPIAYWRPAETIPKDNSVLTCLTCPDGRWMPYPLEPPMPAKSVMVNLLETVSDDALIAEINRRLTRPKS